MPTGVTTPAKDGKPKGSQPKSRNRKSTKKKHKQRYNKNNAKAITPVKEKTRAEDNEARKRKQHEPTGDSPDAKQQKNPTVNLTSDIEMEDDDSQDTCAASNFKYKTYKIFLVINTPSPVEKDYLNDATVALNKWLEVVQAQDKHAGLAIWTTNAPTKVLKEIPPKVTVWEKHVYGFKANKKRGGSHYWRVNLALSSTTKVEEVLKELEQWEDKPRQWTKMAPTQCKDPIQLGWFLRSIRPMVDTPRWAELMTQAIGVPVGLAWAKVMDGTFKKIGLPYAVHVECDEKDKYTVLNYMKKKYGTKSPTEANVYFIRNQSVPGMVMSGTEKAVLGKLISYQRNHLKVIGYEFNDRITDIDVTIASVKGKKTLRQILMNLKVKAIEGRVGDRLFLSIDETVKRGVSGFQFTYHRFVAQEAEQVAAHLPLYVRAVLKTDPVCCCMQSYVEMYSDWTWDKRKNLSCNKESEDMEKVVQDLKFLSNDELNISDTQDGESNSITEREYNRINGKDDETMATLVNPKAVPKPKQFASTASTASNVSELTGSTTESKAQRYASRAVKEVSDQYRKEMQRQKEQFAQQCNKQQQALQMMMKQCEASGMDTSKITSLLNSSDSDENTSQQSGQDSGRETGKHSSSSDSSLESGEEYDGKSHHSSGGETDFTPTDEKNDNYKRQDDDDDDPTPRNSADLKNTGNGNSSPDTGKSDPIECNDTNGGGANTDAHNNAKTHSTIFGKQTTNKHGFYTMKMIDWSHLRKQSEQASPDSSTERFCARIKATKERTQKILDAVDNSSISSDETLVSGASRSPPRTRSRAKKLLSNIAKQRTGAITGECA